MAQVTAAFGMGSPALSRTTARICSVRPTRNCESSERMWTMAGVWAAAVAAASRTTQARMAVLLKNCFVAGRDDFEPPANRSLTVAALLGGLSGLQECPH